MHMFIGPRIHQKSNHPPERHLIKMLLGITLADWQGVFITTISYHVFKTPGNPTEFRNHSSSVPTAAPTHLKITFVLSFGLAATAPSFPVTFAYPHLLSMPCNLPVSHYLIVYCDV